MTYSGSNIDFADPQLKMLVKKTHAYSGLDPGNYRIFVDDMRRVERNKDEKLLYKCLDRLRDLSKNVPGGDTDIHEQLENLAFAIGQCAEAIIFNKRLKDGTPFIPNYLNQNVK